MDSACEILANGIRTTNYGEHPSGLMIIDHAGRYSIQIFRRDRPPFKSGDKTRGTPEEYRTAVLGSSTHFGRVSIDRGKHQLLFDVESASFPNWEGTAQKRPFTITADQLKYSVAAASGGGSGEVVWKRVK